MDYASLQARIYENKIRKGFNTTDLGKEIILLLEEYGELSDAVICSNSDETLDAVGDLMVYAIGLCALFKKDANKIVNLYAQTPKASTVEGYLPFLGREIGLMAKVYRRSNKLPLPEIDSRDALLSHLGNILGYCSRIFVCLNQDQQSVLDDIVTKNEGRTNQIKI